MPDDVTFSLLDRDVRGRLRTLSKDNAERVGRHLVMVGRLLDEDAEAAYEHAQAAVRRAGRVDVVREAAGLAAYRTGRYAEALRELRTVRRLNGSSEHLPIMADAERGLGRPERAIALSQEPEAATLDPEGQIELAIVVSGARLDLGQPEAAIAALSGPVVKAARGLVAARVAQARAAALEAAGRPDEATAELAAYSQDVLDEAAGNTPEHEDVVVYDLTEDEDEDAEPADGADLTGDVDSDHETPDERPDAAGAGLVAAHAAAVSDVEDAVSDSAVSDSAVSDAAASDSDGAASDEDAR
ncbi:hypothetical protein [Cellulomonas xiejunii]|uniref:Replicase polyprotein 1ab n=1 Tax=Cellulomonas xiejunii TaxID=2968083 RepID=A0ABY5KSI3_9CELL|nr:hypothetical protein [Cellulomonas xiejunii]MCC2322899.1 hypothetical protein [Cellulomonas xiejunii]UUI73399.1 hypothetical protein NP048_08225 [Cellulomonas xiejunii]